VDDIEGIYRRLEQVAADNKRTEPAGAALYAFGWLYGDTRRGHINSKYDCHTCWARPLCAGGCHHEAFVRYGDTGHPNLHYCDWIRDWTETCLEIYGSIAARNPGFLQQFAERKAE